MKRGIFGNIKALISFIFFSALFLAALRQFDWDLVRMVTWCFDSVWRAIVSLADYFGSLPGFRDLFR